VVQIHSVADLTSGLTDFIPPTIQLVGPDSVSDEENPLFGAEGEEPVLPYGTIDELIDLIRGAVEPSFWEGDVEGAEIRSSGEHSLVVKATPEIQTQVEQFLNDLRGFAGIVVTVETRFLEIGDAFLRDVGVDIRGLGGQTPGPLVNLDDVTNGLEDNASAGFDNGGNGLATGAALNPSAGAYFNDGADGDFRGRTENIFDNSLGNVLSALGGASLTLSYLDDTDVAMIIRATEKSLQARTLTAPKITVFNTQRANLTVVNQLSYIQDFDVEVAQTSFIADPIVGIIQDGLTLDVRPTVSNDRHYITLELQPTVATLLRPIPTFATTLASSFAPVIIQLPELRLQQARVTVRIPDRGSILIGGLKNITTVDRQSETPLLADIPILSFFFSRKGRADEVGHLMILVRAEITDLQEQSQDLMGAGASFDTAFDR
jgi:general secretion pathway protein D